MKNYNLLSDVDLQGKTVLLRAGFDVPYDLAKNNDNLEDDTEKAPWIKVEGVASHDDDTEIEIYARVNNDSRIKAVVPSMQYILREGAALVIASHQSRPKGKRIASMSQKPLVPVIEALLDKPVQFVSDCVGDEAKTAIKNLQPGQVLLLENLRYHNEEKQNDDVFAQNLAENTDVYVNDAFSTSHREHASMVGITNHLPSYMGIKLQEEVEQISEIIEDPEKPITLIISGAKMETKVPVIEKFLDKCDDILLGGCIANTFIASTGNKVGQSKYQEDQIEIAQGITFASCNEDNAKVHIPIDAVISDKPSEDAITENVIIEDSFDENKAIFDIGESTLESYKQVIENSKTIIWNGPVGITEKEQFADGSKGIADSIVEATINGAKSLIGGGDTVEFLERFGYKVDQFTHVSTGGGAMLEFMSGKDLPALKVLEKNQE